VGEVGEVKGVGEVEGAMDSDSGNTPDAATSHQPRSTLSLDEALERCENMMRVRPCVMQDRTNGVVGCAWVVRRHVLSKVRLFAHSYLGGGDALMLNLWLGASLPQRGRPAPPLPIASEHPLQRYLFDPSGPFAKPLQTYRKRLHHHLQLPLQCAYLPCTLLHLYHGELASRRTEKERFQLWQQRRFQSVKHVRTGEAGRYEVHRAPSVTSATLSPSAPSAVVFQWTPDFRTTGINTDALATFERSHSVREKALLRMAKVRRCMEALRTQVAEVVTVERRSGAQEAAAHLELSAMMRGCLAAFG